jgi:hypothetical protein
MRTGVPISAETGAELDTAWVSAFAEILRPGAKLAGQTAERISTEPRTLAIAGCTADTPDIVCTLQLEGLSQFESAIGAALETTPDQTLVLFRLLLSTAVLDTGQPASGSYHDEGANSLADLLEQKLGVRYVARAVGRTGGQDAYVGLAFRRVEDAALIRGAFSRIALDGTPLSPSEQVARFLFRLSHGVALTPSDLDAIPHLPAGTVTNALLSTMSRLWAADLLRLEERSAAQVETAELLDEAIRRAERLEGELATVREDSRISIARLTSALAGAELRLSSRE